MSLAAKARPACGTRLCNNIVQLHCFSIALRQYQRYRQLQRTARIGSKLAHAQLSTYLHRSRNSTRRCKGLPRRARGENFAHIASNRTPVAQQVSKGNPPAPANKKKTLYLPPPCLPKIARAGLPYFIQAENEEAIWAPDSRHRSGEGNQGSHNAGKTMI